MFNFRSKRALVTMTLIACILILAVFVSMRVLYSGATSTEKYNWVQVTAKANWEPGYAFSVLAFNNKLWIFGQSDGIWVSTDGKNWTKTSPTENLPTGYNSYLVFNNEVYAIGGAESQLHLGEKAVWKSRDGTSWTLLTQNPEWPARVWHTSVVFDDTLWLIGGYDGDYKNDVWYSNGGVSWSLATASAPWDGRCMHASVAFDNKIWVIGGRRDMENWWEKDFNDVWCSTDGINWLRATSSADWSKRYGHASIVWNGKLWVMGGTRLFRNNEVWFSKDGANWITAGNAGWTPRFSMATVVFQDKIWAMGGKESGGRFKDDVWYMVPSQE